MGETVAVMREAKAKGFVVGIISNHLDFWFETCAEAFSLSEIVPPNLVVVSQSAGCKKPDLEIYEKFLAQLAAEHPGLKGENCVFVDDKQANCDGAVAVG